MMVIHECAEAHERLSSLVGCKRFIYGICNARCSHTVYYLDFTPLCAKIRRFMK